jgi:bifunctional UDP-N-acetylglucosamine pyrophosphorylase/glucosamine-1-phosphate N-acetyltransferase
MEQPGRLGRVAREQNGQVARIVEALDASERSVPSMRSTRASIASRRVLSILLHDLTSDNVKGEYYLTDVIGAACRSGLLVQAVPCDDWREAIGVDSKADLARAEALLRQQVPSA